MLLLRLSHLPTSLLLLSLLPSALAQIGASPSNVSSNATQMAYVGTWRSSFLDDVYQAYSNESGASVTFSFEGVRASYVAIKKADRGLSLVQVDWDTAYTVDLYDDSGTVQVERIVWTSPVLPFGKHNVTVSQIGPDARFGYYPYLFTETWIEYVPDDLNAYLSTQITPSSTAGNPSSTSLSSPSSSGPSIAPIVGGVVGGVIALILLGFLFFLWRRDQRNRARGGGVKKVKKAEGKMSIEDEPPQDGGMAYVPPEGSQRESSRGSYYPHPPSAYADPYGGYGAPSEREGSVRGNGSRMYEPISRAEERPRGAYPYHTQGFGDERRSYPVPEI